jgi:hypothetical protein
MAYVTKSRGDRWEIRESHSSPEGPRSHTLATFERLSDEDIARASERSGKPLDPEGIRAAARRVGAPVAHAPGNEAAIALLRAIGDGESLHPGLRKLLGEALGFRKTSANGEAILQSIGLSEQERAADLVDLLLLSDAVPARRNAGLNFPPLPGL